MVYMLLLIFSWDSQVFDPLPFATIEACQIAGETAKKLPSYPASTFVRLPHPGSAK